MARNFTVTGLPQMDAALKFAAAALHAAAVVAVATEVRAIEADAERLAPVDDGELRDGIQGKASGTNGEVRSTARHGMFVEFGTTRTRAQPHMAPAAEASKSRFTGLTAALARKAVS